MPRYEETDFPPDIEVMVAASNWCLSPSPQGWKRLRAAVAAGHAMPTDMGEVLDAIEAVRGLCDGQIPQGPAARDARDRLASVVERVAHDRRVANGIRRPAARAPGKAPAKMPAAAMPAEEMPEDAPGQWWQR